MSDSKSLTLLLIVLCAMSFGAEFFGFSRTSEAGWKASPELVDSLSKQRAGTNYREQQVPKYTLPDPLVTSDGKRVADAATRPHPACRELDGRIGVYCVVAAKVQKNKSFRTHVYGRAPVGRPKNMTFECFDFEPNALGGSAVRKQVSVNFTGNKNAPAMDMLIYLPKTVSTPVSTFVLLNFGGNHTINADPAIKLSTSWMRPGRG
ncbi:MAG: hypothetical protein AMJ65_06640, partial [Phycisphaerae bacterium SG8_4]